MPTQAEESQAKEFLKRAEIKTMRKDLLALREVDSLKERDKIAKIRTLDEQIEDKKKADALAATKTAAIEKFGREEILQKNAGQEHDAEKDLKNYATEQERQQIFLLESQRLGFEKQIDAIDKEKDPALKLEKNKILLLQREWQAKLVPIIDKVKKLEDEQKFLAEKSQTSNIPAERKGFEQRRWEADKEIEDIEKKRWEIEKQIEDLGNKVKEIDKSSDQNVAEKNGLRDKVLGIGKSLREIYSVVIARTEEQRRGQTQEQLDAKEASAKLRADQREKVQRQQWSHSPSMKQDQKEILHKAPAALKEKIAKSAETEEEQRKKFLQDVEIGSQAGVKDQLSQEQKSTGPSVLNKNSADQNQPNQQQK